MQYNLTQTQKDALRWIVNAVRAGWLRETDIGFTWTFDGMGIVGYRGQEQYPQWEPGVFDALAHNNLVRIRQPQRSTYMVTLTGAAYAAVDSNFDEPDTSFVRHLTPLADITTLDDDIKQRCLPILGAGAADPALWDSAVRTAGVILEERMRDVGGISDASRVGRNLVNDLFRQNGTLAPKFTVESEREGYRDLYAGAVGIIRNPSAHRLIDPTPEEGGAYIVFVNLLLKKLEDLR